jgi:hypothetical protein
MKKFLIPGFAILSIVIFLVINLKRMTNDTPVLVENNRYLQQDLILSFKNFRESLYQLKQFELMKNLKKETSLKKLKPQVCLKIAYDLQAFVMRSRLSPQAIEKADCLKMNQYFVTIAATSLSGKIIKPSYQKRLETDLAYFTEELSKQEWKNEELIKKKKDFDQKTSSNRLKLKKNRPSKKISEVSPAKCMKTIFMHEKEFRAVCKKK